jgi:hypothetical protein
MKNPGFIIVCVLIAVAPLMRGSVHAWAQTVIQVLVVLGGIVLVLEAMRARARRALWFSWLRCCCSKRDLPASGWWGF